MFSYFERNRGKSIILLERVVRGRWSVVHEGRMMKKIAVFASGSGSNFQALVDAIKAGKLEAEICLVVCDKPKVHLY